MMRATRLVATALLAVSVAGSSARAEDGHGTHPPRQDWSFAGIFGKFDEAQLQRGFQIYKDVCAACHSMSLLSYRNLMDLGLSEAAVKGIAADVMTRGGRAQPTLRYALPAQTNLDSNTVDMDRERAAFADNAVRYEATLRFINASVRTTLDAMKSPNQS